MLAYFLLNMSCEKNVKGKKIVSFLQSSKNDFRRKWDKDEYENLAQKRLAEERDWERRDGELFFVQVLMMD